MAIKYVCKCTKCGKTRESYNDPRLRRSVIECKATCFESHYEWEFVSESVEGEATPSTATTTTVSAPPPTAPPRQANADESNRDRPPVKNAFTDGPPPPPPAAKKPDAEKKDPEAADTKKSGGICTML